MPESPVAGPSRGCFEAFSVTFVGAGGFILSDGARLPFFNLGVVAALAALLLTLAFVRTTEAPSGAVGGLLLFIGVYALVEAREGRGRATEWLEPVVLILGFLTALRLVRLIYRAKGTAAERRLAWGAAFLVPLLVLLASYSGSGGGTSNMSAWFSWLPPQAADVVIIAVRKAVHSTYYPLLTLSALAAFTRVRPGVRANAPWALGFAAIFACFDELRQASIPNRSGQALDVALDLAASAIVLLIVLKRARRDEEEASQSGE